MKGLKRKLLASTLAVGMLFGSVISVNAIPTPQELPSTADTLVAKLNQIYGYLSVSEKDSIDAARTDIISVLDDRDEIGDTDWLEDYGVISEPLWSILGSKVSTYNDNNDPDLVNITEANLLTFALHFGIINYDPTFSDFEEYRTNEFRGLMNDLAILGGMSGGMEDLDFVDVTSFYSAIESATRSTVSMMPAFDDFSDLVDFKNALETAIQTVLTAEATNMAEVLNNSGVTAEALLDTKIQMQLEVPSVISAELALASAYRTMIAATTPVITPDPDPVVETPGVLPTIPGQASEVAKEVLKALADKLADLPADELKGELKKAEDAVEKAIKEAAQSDIVSVITNGVAIPTIDQTAILAKAKEAKTLADSLNKDLVAAGGKSVKVEFTMDLGTIDADEIQFPFDKSFMNDMAAAGIDFITVLVNGVQISVDTNEFGANSTLNIEKKTKAEAGDTTGKTTASDYYEFNFTSNGSNVEEFKFPVVVKIPVDNAADFDTELLTLAKVEDGKLIYFVGKYNAESGLVEGTRDSFSTYVIVENKVAFNDITSVKSWAGRSIEVAAAKGVIVGRAEGEFVPAANVTRAEFAKMLVTAFSVSTNNTSESFDDVDDTHWFKPYVAAAFSNGIISGRSATSFDPNAPITRQEMAAMVARILKSSLDETDATDASAELSIYSDADKIGSVFQASVALATEQGILTGSAGTFKPLGITTRAEAAVVINKLISLL